LKQACERTGQQAGPETGNQRKSMPSAELPFVSIILCTRGLRPTLLPCLERLADQGQAYGRSEIIVVLNGPQNPDFAEAVSRFPVKLVNEHQPGVSAARNYAVPRSRGDILVFVDDDILVDSNWLEELIKGFDDPRVACVTGRVIPAGVLSMTTERAERYYASERALSTWTLDASEPDWYQYIVGEPVGFGCNMAFRRTFLETCSMFPLDLGAGSLIGGGDEFYMYLQVIKHGFRIRHVPAAAVTHYFEDSNDKSKARNAQLYSGSVAFALKMLLEEKTLRGATFKWLVSALGRRLRRVWTRKAIASEPQELLSPVEKITAYLKGVGVYWKSHQARNSANRSEPD
jgi:glycosyltransferase involved in cell wall biosynthesis